MTPPAEIVSQEEAIQAQASLLYGMAILAMKPGTPRYSAEGERIAEFQFKEGFREGALWQIAAAAEHSKRAIIKAKIEALEWVNRETAFDCIDCGPDVRAELARLRAQVAP